MSRYLYKKIQNISPESLNFQHSGLKLTTLGSDPNVLHNTAKGARSSALVYSISETAKLNNLRPYYYFRHILTG